MNVLCALGLHKEGKGVYEIRVKRGKKGQTLRRHYAVCKRCGKRLRRVKSQEMVEFKI